MPIIYKKRVRLRNFDYKGCFRYFVTICTHNKEWVFKNDLLLAEWLTDILREKSSSFGFKVWAYCFMPDHLHLLIEGKDNNSNMRRFISSYKQSTSFSYKKKTGLPLWQINYYEHVLRREEDTMNVARYIFNNPVRKELVGDLRKYKSLGSFEFDTFDGAKPRFLNRGKKRRSVLTLSIPRASDRGVEWVDLFTL